MENDHIRTILNNIENGTLTASEAYAQLKLAPFEDLGYAKVDHHREVRQGAPEVIYGASKTKEQIEGITVLEDGNLKYHFYKGRTERWQRV